MSTKQIRIFAPASIANIGPGFDVFGIAIDKLGDTLRIETIPEREVEIKVSGIGAEEVPNDAVFNSAGAVIRHVLERRCIDYGFRIEITKGVPPGKGLGSSGSSAAASTIAINKLLGLHLSRRELVELAAVGEAAVSGSPHADNVSASLFGGFTMVSPDYEVINLEPPELEIVIVVPEINYEKKTRLARTLLPDKVRLRDAVHNVGNASKMVAAIALKDPILFGKSISDNLIEPHRAILIPNFWKVKEAALDSGAYGCSIAGGGPSLFAVGENPREIKGAMEDAFRDAGVLSESFLVKPSAEGARVI